METSRHNSEDIPETDYTRPRPAKDGYTSALYNQWGLSQEPSLAELEPRVRDELESHRYLEGFGALLGRLVNTTEIAGNEDLQTIFWGMMNAQTTDEAYRAGIVGAQLIEIREAQQVQQDIPPEV